MASALAEALLDMDLRTMSGDEWGEACKLFPEECAYLLVRLKSSPDEPVTRERLEWDLQVTWRYPHSLDYYRDRAEDARWSRLDQKLHTRELS